jgi:hypothetical protein
LDLGAMGIIVPHIHGIGTLRCLRKFCHV